MHKNLKQISDLINKQKNIEDEKKFKVASATLICSIVNIEKKNSEKYCSLFQESFNLSKDEFNRIKENLLNDGLSIDDKVNYIKTELGNNMYQVMQFLKILNRFAILDGCSQNSYREFELIRDKFLKSHY
jgi:predicted transcriptional regulator